jgi:hypothetical protein
MQRNQVRSWVRLQSGLVEIWENPDAPFAYGADAFQRYAARGEWVLLFNALALSAGRIYLA